MQGSLTGKASEKKQMTVHEICFCIDSVKVEQILFGLSRLDQ